MKKFLSIIFLVFLLVQAQANAEDCYSKYCPVAPYPVSSNGVQNLQKYTGINFISRHIAQSIIKSQLKKETKGKYKVNMALYGTKDLMNGKFKSLHFVGTGLNADGIYISKLEAKTLCDFNSVELNKNTLKFRENMAMSFNMEITSEDLQKTVKSSGYIDMLNKINLSSFGITFFKLSSANVYIQNSKIYFVVNVTTPLSSRAIPIKLSSDVKVSDGKIVLTQVDFANRIKIIDLNELTTLLNYLNPLTFTTNILDNKTSKIKIDSVNIVGTKICIDGYIYIPKNTVTKG